MSENNEFICKNLNLNNKYFKFYLRSASEADYGVYKQIFERSDYSISRWKRGKFLTNYYNYLVKEGKRPLIIDSGANIGAATAYFLSWYPRAISFGLEPEPSNCKIFRRNLNEFQGWHLYEGALASSKKILKLKLGSDWGHRISNDGTFEVSCIGVSDIIDHEFASDAIPFILKIDIEGGEDDVFDKDISWLEKFPLLIIEPHDWMLPFSGCSRSFMKAIVNFDFDIVMHGENIFFFNKKILSEFMVI